MVAACPRLQRSDGGKHVAILYEDILVGLRYDYNWRRVRPVVDKLLELAPRRRALVDRDRAYAHVIEAAWRRRYSDPEALVYVAAAEEKRRELAPKLKAARRR